MITQNNQCLLHSIHSQYIPNSISNLILLKTRLRVRRCRHCKEMQTLKRKWLSGSLVTMRVWENSVRSGGCVLLWHQTNMALQHVTTDFVAFIPTNHSKEWWSLLSWMYVIIYHKTYNCFSYCPVQEDYQIEILTFILYTRKWQAEEVNKHCQNVV